jgi:hypothetical protein
VSKPVRAALVVSIIHSPVEMEVHDQCIEEIRRLFGDGVTWPGRLPFDKTTYYEKEMGQGLVRTLWMSLNNFDRAELPAIKNATNGLECRFARPDMTRRINLDPGFLTAENFILATTKNYSHRVYMRDGIFADLTLIYKNGEFQPLPWTYPDYAGSQIRNILKTWRNAYIKNVKNLND